MNSGFLSPRESLFMDLDIPKYLKTFKNHYGDIFENHFCYTSQIWEHKKMTISDQTWKRRAQKNDEDPSKNISEILDMRSLSIKKHEMGIW